MPHVSQARLQLLRDALAQARLDAFYVRNTSDIRWLTGFDGVFDSEAAHLLYVDAERAVLHTDSRYAEACYRAAEGTCIEVNTLVKSHADVAALLWGARWSASAAATDDGACSDDAGVGDAPASACADALLGDAEARMGLEDSITLGEWRKLCAALDGGESFLQETSGLVLSLRAVKDACEVARLKAAQAITDAAFSHIAAFVRPGMTEREVQLELEDFMRRRGADDLAFSSIVATGANGASPHAIPGDTRLEAGQCVVLDFGARAQGYCSDMTRMLFLGTPSAKMQDAYAALVCANEEVEAMLRPGVTGRQAHELAERILAAAGFEGKMGHGLGHGVGLDIHESPNLNTRNEKPLVAGNVVTVEPGIYLPGEFGMRLEDFGIVTERGFEVFTQSTHDMVIV